MRSSSRVAVRSAPTPSPRRWAAPRGLAVDLSNPATIAESLASVTRVDNLVITAIDQGHQQSQRRSTSSMRSRPSPPSWLAIPRRCVCFVRTSRRVHLVVLFGGLLQRNVRIPAPTMVTTFNGGVSALVKTLVAECAPHRVNAVHPGVVGDSPNGARSPIIRRWRARRSAVWSRWMKWPMRPSSSCATAVSARRICSWTAAFKSPSSSLHRQDRGPDASSAVVPETSYSAHLFLTDDLARIKEQV